MFVWLPFFLAKKSVCMCVLPQTEDKRLSLQPRADARRQRCMGCIARCVDTNTYNLLPGSPNTSLVPGGKKNMKWIRHVGDIWLSICAGFFIFFYILLFSPAFCSSIWRTWRHLMVESNLVKGVKRESPQLCIDKHKHRDRCTDSYRPFLKNPFSPSYYARKDKRMIQDLQTEGEKVRGWVQDIRHRCQSR